MANFSGLFKQTVKLALEVELASLGRISLDGSKFKADTSKQSGFIRQDKVLRLYRGEWGDCDSA
ncbi:MAG: hypothetical protein PHY54_12915 [Methylococcales bacterium]|nr:hypothetical protein [Methylococcales bacterium]